MIVVVKSHPEARAGQPPTVWPPAARAITTLHPIGCRWPLGEVADEDFRFCNTPCGRGSYCTRHGAAAVQGARA